MRIGFVAPAPFSALSGGYIYDRRMVEGLRARGHEVQVIELPGRHPLPDEAALAGARAALERTPEEVRLVIDGLGLPAFAPLAPELERRRAVGLVHHPTALETGFPDADRLALKSREREIFPRLARIVAPSHGTAKRLPEEFGCDPARLGVVEPGTDAATRAMGSGSDTCAILSVGTLVPRKGHDVLLRALGRLSDLDWMLTIVGSPDRDPVHAHGLQALAEELGIANRVTFAGERTDEALEAFYQRADIFALATHWEGYGMVIAEALARGIPFAITAGGAAADLAPKEASVVSPPGDHASLGRAMRRMIFDRALRARMADAAWGAGQRLPRWSDRAVLFEAELMKAEA
ncbi:MAG TPA: glycosyltransferase family 4 protein [Acetobacteraceae bacterium]|nr:glycosyltransferase family 4 protein [Acetobacteraceae bacterium]